MNRMAHAPAVSRRARTIVAITLGAALAIGTVGAVISASASSSDPAVIDGSAVTSDELSFHMLQERPRVENALGRERGESGVDWASDDDALDELRSRAFDQLAADRALFQLAEEAGLVAPWDFEEFLDSVGTTNDQRAEQRDRGDIVYGPTSFAVQEFYTRMVADLRTSLIQRMSSGESAEIVIDERDVRERFDAEPESWAVGATVLSTSRLTAPAASEASLREAVESAASEGAAGLDLESLAAGVAGAAIEPVELHAVDAPGIDPRLLADLAAADIGTTLGPVPFEGGWALYRVDDRLVDRDAAYEQYASRIHAVLVEERFEQLLEARIAEQHHQIDHVTWNRVTVKEPTA